MTPRRVFCTYLNRRRLKPSIKGQKIRWRRTVRRSRWATPSGLTATWWATTQIKARRAKRKRTKKTLVWNSLWLLPTFELRCASPFSYSIIRLFSWAGFWGFGGSFPSWPKTWEYSHWKRHDYQSSWFWLCKKCKFNLNIKNRQFFSWQGNTHLCFPITTKKREIFI